MKVTAILWNHTISMSNMTVHTTKTVRELDLQLPSKYSKRLLKSAIIDGSQYKNDLMSFITESFRENTYDRINLMDSIKKAFDDEHCFKNACKSVLLFHDIPDSCFVLSKIFGNVRESHFTDMSEVESFI